MFPPFPSPVTQQPSWAGCGVVPAPSPPPLLPPRSQLSSWGWNDRVGEGGTSKPISLLRTFLPRKKHENFPPQSSQEQHGLGIPLPHYLKRNRWLFSFSLSPFGVLKEREEKTATNERAGRPATELSYAGFHRYTATPSQPLSLTHTHVLLQMCFTNNCNPTKPLCSDFPFPCGPQLHTTEVTHTSFRVFLCLILFRAGLWTMPHKTPFLKAPREKGKAIASFLISLHSTQMPQG